MATIKYTVVLFVCIINCLPIFCQASEGLLPEINKLCPDFSLDKMNYFEKSKISLEGLRGKFVILDFFATGCTSCFASLQENSQLQQKFRDKLQVIMIGYKDDKIEALYEKFRLRQKLKLAVQYDTLLFKQWNITGVPFLVWINDKGIVKAVTTSHDMTEANVEAFVNDRFFFFTDNSEKAMAAQEKSFDTKKPFLVNGNLANDSAFLYRSLLAQWNTRMPQIANRYIDRQLNVGRFQVAGVPLYWLYNYAFFGQSLWTAWGEDSMLYGKAWSQPVLETADSGVFAFDFRTGARIYVYSLSMPVGKASKERFKEILQQDLKNYFGFDARMETRIMPYWRLTATDGARINLKTKSGKKLLNILPGGVIIRNHPLHFLIAGICSFHWDMPPVIDETNIDYNIDLDIDVLLADWESLKKSLKQNGLLLEMGQKPMQVLVIRDSPVH